jgi:DNA-binding transcriptional ArsR family regulator
VPLPSDTMHYVYHDRMSADKVFLYQLVIDFYNPVDGYAYPSIDLLALHYGKSEDTTSKHINDLKAIGLIDFQEKGYYVPLTPLTADEFYAKFPEAWVNYKRKYERMHSRREKAKDRMREWRKQQGYTE